MKSGKLKFGYLRIVVVLASLTISILNKNCLFAQAVTVPADASRKAQKSGSELKLNQLAYFLGTWSCKVQDVAPNLAESAGEMVWTIRDVNGSRYSISGQYVRKREPNRKILLDGSIRYDTSAKQFLQFVSTNEGSQLIFNSSGWQGNTLTWQGVQVEKEGDYRLRRVTKKTSDRTFENTQYIFDPATSQWKPVIKLFCKK